MCLCVLCVCVVMCMCVSCVCGCMYTCTLRMLHNIKLHSFCTGRPSATAPCVHCFLSGDPADGKLPHSTKQLHCCTAHSEGWAVGVVGGGERGIVWQSLGAWAW